MWIRRSLTLPAFNSAAHVSPAACNWYDSWQRRDVVFKKENLFQSPIMTVRHLSVDYKKTNEHGTFSPGDTISGQVTVVTSGKIKAQCLLVKAKGKAQVGWCEQDGNAPAVCSDKRKYFCLEHIILQDKNKGDGLCHLLLIQHSGWLQAPKFIQFIPILFFLFSRFWNYSPWKKCLPIHLCDSKHVCVLKLIRDVQPWVLQADWILN